jgi:hypothetical protein
VQKKEVNGTMERDEQLVFPGLSADLGLRIDDADAFRHNEVVHVWIEKDRPPYACPGN